MAKPTKPAIAPESAGENNRKQPLTVAQRLEITRRIQAGEETFTQIARAFGVSRQAIANFNRDEKAGPIKRLSPEEEEAVRQLVEKTLPSAHGLRHPGMLDHEEWTKDRLHAVGEKIAGRALFVHPFKRLLEKWFPASAGLEWNGQRWENPQPGSPPPPAAAPLPRRKWARRRSPLDMPPPEMWEKLMPGFRLPGEDSDAPTFRPVPTGSFRGGKPGPMERTGKHKGSKALPTTQPKKKKR